MPTGLLDIPAGYSVHPIRKRRFSSDIVYLSDSVHFGVVVVVVFLQRRKRGRKSHAWINSNSIANQLVASDICRFERNPLAFGHMWVCTSWNDWKKNPRKKWRQHAYFIMVQCFQRSSVAIAAICAQCRQQFKYLLLNRYIVCVYRCAQFVHIFTILDNVIQSDACIHGFGQQSRPRNLLLFRLVVLFSARPLFASFPQPLLASLPYAVRATRSRLYSLAAAKWSERTVSGRLHIVTHMGTGRCVSMIDVHHPLCLAACACERAFLRNYRSLSHRFFDRHHNVRLACKHEKWEENRWLD